MRNSSVHFRVWRQVWPRGICLLCCLAWLVGCGGTLPQSASIKMPVQAQKPQNPLQENLMAQMSRVTLKGYQDYAIGPEDLLEITFYGDDDLNRETRVNGRGEISLPLVSQVQVSGLSPDEVQSKLEKLYKEMDIIKKPQLSVNVKEYRHQRVMVTGAVATPGSHEMIGPRTLLEMLGKAGGFNDKSGDVVYIIRSQSAPARLKALKETPLEPFSAGTETIAVDLNRLLAKGDLALNFPIKSGDVIYVPYAKNAYVLGAVNKPGSVFIKDNLTVSQAVALAGGHHILLASNQTSVVRFDEQGQRIVLTVDLGRVTTGKEEDPVLKENDVVYVQENMLKRLMFDIKNMIPGSFGASAPLAF